MLLFRSSTSSRALASSLLVLVSACEVPPPVGDAGGDSALDSQRASEDARMTLDGGVGADASAMDSFSDDAWDQADVCDASDASDGSAASDAPDDDAWDVPDAGDAWDLADACDVSDASAVDVFSDDAWDATSDARADAAVEPAVYVALSGNDANSGLDPARPVRTITRALAVKTASCAACEIHVGIGTYNEAMSLTSGVIIRGGYDPLAGWARTGARRDTTFTNPDGFATLRITVGAQDVTVDRFTFVQPAGTLRNPSSITATVTSAARVNIRDSDLISGAGFKGADGLVGATDTSCPNNGGAGGTASDCAAGGGAMGGLGALGGAAGGAGGAGGTSYCVVVCPTLNQQNVTPGRSGLPGGLGAIPSSIANPTSNRGAIIAGFSPFVPEVAPSGSTGGNGSGGGGGGAGGTKRGRACGCVGLLLGGTGGRGGRGGCGGRGGSGGTQGGASIAIVVYSGTMDFTGSSVRTGTGGSGGDGGLGGPASPAASGAVGAPGASTNCSLLPYSAAPGGAGGGGGPGTDGQGGAGGAGGPSIGVAFTGTATIATPPTFFIGAGGTSGLGGRGSIRGPFGAGGLSAQTLRY